MSDRQRKTPLVSVVMPSYNHEKFIAEAISSVLGQDFSDFELLIVDDASPDASRQIIQKYAAEDFRIRVILHETNRGIAKTMNDGIDIAKGKFVAIIDSDDVWAKDKLTKQLAVAVSNEDFVIWSEGEVIDDKGQPIGLSFSELNKTVYKKKSGHIFEDLLLGNYIFGSTLFCKKHNLAGIRFDERLRYLNDYKFALELAQKWDFYYVAEPLAKYRIHDRSTLGRRLNGSAIGSITNPKLEERVRISMMEEVTVREQMLQQYDNTVSTKTKASVYRLCRDKSNFVRDYEKALAFALRAVKYDPLSRSMPASAWAVLKYALLSLIYSRKQRNED
jgi:glycosyltransferase involved in cell wall biosynthesis